MTTYSSPTVAAETRRVLAGQAVPVVAENFVCCPGVHYGQSGDAFLDAAHFGIDAPSGPMRFPFEALVERALDGLGEGSIYTRRFLRAIDG